MEAVMFHSSADQQISPNKNYFRSSKKIMNRTSLIPRFSEDFAPTAYLQGGLLQAPVPNHPPFLFQSFPVFSVHRQQQQPPLLPLPVVSNGGYSVNFSQSRTLSCPPNYGRANNKSRSRDPSLTPKKSKQISKSPKKEDKLKSTKEDYVVISSTVPLGPDPEHLPKDVPKFSSKGCVEVTEKDEGDKFSGSVVFTLSPPPSSLPLPTFSLRPKLSCNAEAAGIDTGATDNLCRLLRLR